MFVQARSFRRGLRTVADWARPSLLPAAIAATVIFIAGHAYEEQDERLYRNELHARVANELVLISARLEGEIDKSVSALRGLANMFAVSPGQAAAQFHVLSRKLLVQNVQFRRVSAAPSGVVAQTFPQFGNEHYNGTDLNRFRSFRTAAESNRAFGRPVMLGPVQLPDGSRAFNLFIPVFDTDRGAFDFWGYIEGVIDERRIYTDAGLVTSTDGRRSEQWKGGATLGLSIRDVSVAGSVQDPFFGNPDIFSGESVRRTVDFPGGSWELAAVPAEGWETPSANANYIRVLTAAAALVIIIPIFLTGGLVSERQRHRAGLRERETEIRALSQRLDLALAASKTGIWEIAVGSGKRSWDRQMFLLHGLAEGPPPGTAEWRALVHPDDLAAAEADTAAALNGASYFSQYRIVLPDGAVRHIRNVGSRLAIDGEEKLTGISWDVTEDVRLNDRLKAAKDDSDRQREALVSITQRLDMALDAYQCGLWEQDLEDGYSLWDDRMRQLYGLHNAGERVSQEAWLSAIHPEDRQRIRQNVIGSIRDGVPYLQKFRVIQPDGSIRHVQSVGKVHGGTDGRRKFVGLAFDITADVLITEQLRHAKALADAKNAELALAKDRIEHNALHDPLTGLGNRRKLDDHLNALATRSESAEVRIGILHIDLDRFKQINDTLGHAAGDALLVHVAKILSEAVTPGDLVARIGGDEFVVVLTERNSRAYLSTLSKRVIDLMRQPVEYNGHMCRFGVSIGVAVGNGMRLDTRKLLVNADIALYRAKAQGRNRHEFFNSILEAEIVRNKRMADDILSGIENNEFVPYYQPQICARTLELVGAEALIRWKHPQNGLMVPARFLAIAEDLNVMATLDRIMLEKALVDRNRWAAMGMPVPKISVNVSARRLRDETLAESLAGLSIQPGQISFELVEAIFLDETDDIVLKNIQHIKELGIDIEIDDFGTGHTSIVSLLKLKPKRLKIDRQLVAPILSSRHEQALVRSIIEIGRSLGIEIVAEGVETMAHAELLSALGCDLLQGYAFASPLSREKFQEYTLAQSWKAAS